MAGLQIPCGRCDTGTVRCVGTSSSAGRRYPCQRPVEFTKPLPLCEHHYWQVRDAFAAEIHEQQRAATVRMLADRDARSLVYYVQRADGAVKVGVSREFERRMTQLRAEHGPLTVLATEPGTREVERQRHREFADQRIAGEWFRPDVTLMAHIAALGCAPDCAPWAAAPAG